MKEVLYKKGMFVLCPTCDRDALEVIEDILPLTDVRFNQFRAIAPTKVGQGVPVESGCCGTGLLEGPPGKRKFAAMRTGAGYAK